MSPATRRLLIVIASGGGSVWAVIALVLVSVAAWLPTAIAEEQAQARTDTGRLCAEGGAETVSEEQRRNAAAITAVARERDLPARAAVIAVATALQESGLRNIDYGDRDSLGLFQQRPSQGWGSPEQVRDPVYAAGQFYDRLVRIDGWEDKPLTRVAQSVQRSGFPDAYAKHEPRATGLVRQVWGEGMPEGLDACDGGGGELGEGKEPSGRARAVLEVARDQLGKPYVWGAEGPNSFDCSGLIVYAFDRGARMTLPRVSQDMRTLGKAVPRSKMRPGDVIVFDKTTAGQGWGHVGIYTGNGKMINAPRPGKGVEVAPLAGYWSQYDWAVRRVA